MKVYTTAAKIHFQSYCANAWGVRIPCLRGPLLELFSFPGLMVFLGQHICSGKLLEVTKSGFVEVVNVNIQLPKTNGWIYTQNDGPWKKWFLFRYGHFFGIYD